MPSVKSLTNMFKITLYLAVFLLNYCTLLCAKPSYSIVDEIQEGIDNLKSEIAKSVTDGSERIAITIKENNNDAVKFLRLYKDDISERVNDKDQQIAKWVTLANNQGINVDECIGNIKELGEVAIVKSQECAAVYIDDVELLAKMINEEFSKFNIVITELKVQLETCQREEESLPCLDDLLQNVKIKNIEVPKEISEKTTTGVTDIELRRTILMFCVATYSDAHFIQDSDKLLEESIQCIQDKLE